CRADHAFIGGYYQRFVPLEDVVCPCGFPPDAELTPKSFSIGRDTTNTHRHTFNTQHPIPNTQYDPSAPFIHYQ
ncbi:hypothetical protein K474DRAFT_1607896, partial [Panus rudis PR-1116 ss-1]